MKLNYLLLSLLCMASLAGMAQSDNTYRLLWYKGKKIKDNVLLTSAGDSVFYNPSKAKVKVVSTGKHGKELDNMLAELNKTDQRMNEMIRKLSGWVPKPALPAISMQVKSAYMDVRDRFNEALSNTISLPDIKLPVVDKNAKGGPWYEEEDIYERFVKAVEELQAWMNAHKDEQITWVPTPPRKEFTYCAPCQKDKENDYKKQFERFIEELSGEDKKKIELVLGISRHAQFLLSDAQNEKIQPDLIAVMEFLMKRATKKSVLLFEQYGNDPYRLDAVLQVGLYMERTNQLMGMPFKAIPDDAMKKVFDTMVAALKKALDEKDYSIALNLQLAIDLDRQSQLMGIPLSENMMIKMLQFNQFKLNMHVSAKARGDGGYQLAEIKGDNWFFAAPDSACRLNWFLVGPLLNKMTVDLTAAEFKGSGGEIPYVGTKKWNTEIPKMHIDFCSNGSDTIEIYQFDPEGFKELWQFPAPTGVINLSQMNAVLLYSFLDSNRLQQEAAKFKDPAYIDKMKSEMMKQYQQMMKNNKTNTIPTMATLTIQDMNQFVEIQHKSRSISEMIHVNPAGRYLFTPTVQNKTAVIIREKLNGKELFPQNTATEYAWFHLTLEHDPDGPHRMHW